MRKNERADKQPNITILSTRAHRVSSRLFRFWADRKETRTQQVIARKALPENALARIGLQRGLYGEASVTSNVTADLQTYTNNNRLSTRGWLIYPDSVNLGGNTVSGQTNGWYFDSSETATLANRPILEVTYQVVPRRPASCWLGSRALAAHRSRSDSSPVLISNLSEKNGCPC